MEARIIRGGGDAVMAGTKRTAAERSGLAERSRARRNEQVREEIVDAAIAEFADRGYHDASLAHIAKRLGTGPSTIYNYFTSKRDILDAAVSDAIERLTDALGEAVASMPYSVDDFTVRATQFGDMLTDVLIEDPRIPRIILMLSTSKDPELRAKWAALHTVGKAAVAMFLSGGIADGFVGAHVDPQATADVIVAIPFGLLACDPDRFAERAHAESAVRAAVSMVTTGIRPR